MAHLGKKIHVNVIDHSCFQELHVDTHKRNIIEGHFLLSVTMNMEIADLWKSKKSCSGATIFSILRNGVKQNSGKISQADVECGIALRSRFWK